jgi:hypothetical protein
MALLSPQSAPAVASAPAQITAWPAGDTISLGDIGDRGVLAIVSNTSGGSLNWRVSDPGLTPASDLTFRSLKFSGTITLHSVATTAEGARKVSGRVTSALLDYTPVVTGRVCGPVRHVDDFMAQPDEETGTNYFTLVDVYRIVSWPG